MQRPVAFLLLALGGASCARSRAPEQRPNILLISLDSTRRDMLGCYGGRFAHAPGLSASPTIDTLAAEGVRFEQAYATTSWTLPSHASLFTGMPELVHAVELDELELAQGRHTLTESLRAAGYRTAGFYSGPYLDARYGFGRGFDRYQAAWGEELAAAIAAEAELRSKIVPGRPPADPQALMEARKRLEIASHRDSSSARVSELGLEELRAARAEGRPWFLFLHYFDPHYDYVPPPPHDRRFDPDYGGSIDGRDFMENPAISVPAPRPGDIKRRERHASERDMEHVRALYGGELSWTDSALASVLEELRRTGELERTLVVILADHGDEFFEHQNLGHRKNLYEESIRVPLVMRYPARLPAGQVVHGPAALSDVAATVLELAGLESPAGSLSRSLVPAIRGEAGSPRWLLGRLVDARPVSSREGKAGLLTTVDEYYLDWPIKILRRRAWVDPFGPMPPAEASAMQQRAELDRARDSQLVWIDLEREPAESLNAYSKDFASPRAKAALEGYQRVYARLLELRSRPGLATGDEDLHESMQRGLGYGGGEIALDPTRIDRFTIGPPGGE